MASRSYEPAARIHHASFAVKGRVYVWGGVSQDSPEDDKLASISLKLNVEQFDPYLEVWSQLNTTGPPHPRLGSAACTSFGECMYLYGGYIGKGLYSGVLSCLDLNTLTWSLLWPPAGRMAAGPMRKAVCGIMHFHHGNLAVIGGYGVPTGPTQPGSSFIRDIRFTNGSGWTNEIHIFDISQGVWLSPIIRGNRPPPCSGFTLTSIDNHRAVLFGGYQPGHGRVNDLYLINFSTMEITRVESHELGKPWPVERSAHAACCLGYAGDHIHLLVTGGLDRDDKPLKDIWLFNVSLKNWTEVSLSGVSLRLPRILHSAITITLCQGLVEVVEFGGRVEAVLNPSGRTLKTITETTIITFSQVGSEWMLVGMANNSQRGSSERVREKMLKISEIERTAIDERRVLQERVEARVREERLRAQDIEKKLQDTVERALASEERIQYLEATLREERQRIQAMERRLQDTTERAEAAEERSQNLEATLREERERVQILERRYAEEIQTQRHRSDQRERELEQQLAASQERERAAEVRVQEAHQWIEQIEQTTEEQIHQIEEQLHQAEERAQAAERRSHNLQQRAHDAEQRRLGAEQQAHELQQRVHAAEQQTSAVERRLHEVEQRARESERRARQAEILVQQSQQESHWLVQRREIELTDEERGRGGWAVVKVANFRGTRVAAKCFYQQILLSRYNNQLFNREMNMAARLRHPNLVQFIGASIEGEPIILTELMATSLRAELEKGPIEHAHITSISLDVARALNYLHQMQPHPIIHRDVSSANVLLDPLPGNGWKAKLSDYGSVNLLREIRTVGPGSPVYAAPEASIPAEQSPKMDIFSFGVLLIEMLTDEFPAEDARQRLLDSINHAGFVNLIRRCLREDKEERPSANEIITNIQDM